MSPQISWTACVGWKGYLQGHRAAHPRSHPSASSVTAKVHVSDASTFRISRGLARGSEGGQEGTPKGLSTDYRGGISMGRPRASAPTTEGVYRGGAYWGVECTLAVIGTGGP
eukprot:9490837-Pyramimonas_sp.AAC.1